MHRSKDPCSFHKHFGSNKMLSPSAGVSLPSCKYLEYRESSHETNREHFLCVRAPCPRGIDRTRHESTNTIEVLKETVVQSFNRRGKSTVTRTECKRLTEESGVGGFMAQNGLWNIALKEVLVR